MFLGSENFVKPGLAKKECRGMLLGKHPAETAASLIPVSHKRGLFS